MTLGVVRVLGWLVIAHGLSHAVLPLRGSLAPAIQVDDWMPLGLYAVSMVGFVASGFGLLGLRPLDRAISPLLVLSSGLSLVAIVRFADPTLWFGGVCDGALLVIGLWRAYGGWPEHPRHGRVWHAAAVASGMALLLYIAASAFLYPWHRVWGSEPNELALALPGDVEPRDAALEIQRAITIDAGLDEVWPWLLQAVGSPSQANAASQHAVVAGGTTYVLLPAGRGETRLVVRSIAGDRRIPVWRSAVNLLAFELPHYVKQRRMLASIKRQAEQRHTLNVSLAK